MADTEKREWPERAFAVRRWSQGQSRLQFLQRPPSGEEAHTYVRYSDHLAELKAVEEERDIQSMVAGEGSEVIEDLRAECERLREALDRLLAHSPLATPEEREYQRAQESGADALAEAD